MVVRSWPPWPVLYVASVVVEAVASVGKPGYPCPVETPIV